MAESKHCINVLNPERHGGDGLNASYISYEITSLFDDGKEYKVRRRYQDFLWLYDQLKHDNPERIIPPLPDKNRLEYLGRFTPDFIKRRQLGLKRFLWRIDGNAYLGNCEVFLNFLRTPVIGMSVGLGGRRSDSQSSINCETSPTSSTGSVTSSYLKPVLESLSDVTATIFCRPPKSVPDAFLNLRKDVKMIRSHLSQLERLFSNRVLGHQPAIIEGMKEIAVNFDELSASIDLNLSSTSRDKETGGEANNLDQEFISPPFVKSMLSRVSATMTQCAHLLDKSIDDQELNLLAVLLEYTQYCDSALEIIEMRDRRQVEVEELGKLVDGYEREIDELEGSKKESKYSKEPKETEESVSESNEDYEVNKDEVKDSNTIPTPTIPTLTPKNTNFFDYISSKWDAWKGVDPITARKNRLQKCQCRLKDTQSALKMSSTLSTRADSALSEEISTFITLLKSELQKEFDNHCKAQVKYHETSLVYWKDFLAWLDNSPKHL